MIDASTQQAFAKLAEAGLIGRSLGGRLIEATRLMRQVQSFLRLTVGRDFDEAAAPEALKASLAAAAGAADLPALRDRLITTAQIVREAYGEIIGEPAKAAAARLEARSKDS